MPKVGFAVSFVVAVLGAVLLIISQIPLTREYYDVVDTHSFSVGEPLTFYSTFEPNVEYRFEVKGVDWTYSGYVRYLMVGNQTYLSGLPGRTAPPWVWDWNQETARMETTCVYNVTFFCYRGGPEIDQASTSTSVEVSMLKETTYHLTYLLYIGLPLLIIGAILVTITGKDVDSSMRISDTSARSVPHGVSYVLKCS